MKINVLLALLMIISAIPAYSGGNAESINTQEISLNGITEINIEYSSDEISIFTGTSDALVIKEYMNRNNKNYYAQITSTGNTVTVKKGNRPLFTYLNNRAEVYLPLSYINSLKIKTSSGRIEAVDNIICQDVNIESSSGRITVKNITAGKVNIKSSSGNIHGNKVAGNAYLKSESGNIVIDSIDGNVSAETSSGHFELNRAAGSVNAKTSSGNIKCTTAETSADITLATSSGSVNLNLNKNKSFNFTSRTSSGRLNTPFPEKLFVPVNDKNLVKGVIGEKNDIDEIPAINIKTSSGSIRIEWI